MDRRIRGDTAVGGGRQDGVPPPERLLKPDSRELLLLKATARVLADANVNSTPTEPVPYRPVTPEQVDTVDPEAVAEWMVGQYPRRSFPGVVVGSAHGAAAHLAAVLGVPWLPAAFEMAVEWPGGATDDPPAAAEYGVRQAGKILAADTGVCVRQVHDPVGRGALGAPELQPIGSTVSLFVRWQRLPTAYRRFLTTHLAPGADVLLVRDARTWPVVSAVGGRYSFQLGSRASGLPPTESGDELPHEHQAYAEYGVESGFSDGLRSWTGRTGHRLRQVVFNCAAALSGSVADVYRHWLRGAGRSADRLAVECGRLLDPRQVLRAGLVPYWCENALESSVNGVEWWLAGSAPFTSVQVLAEPPGVALPAVASLRQWRAVASFGTRLRVLDDTCARVYPYGPVPARHATDVLRPKRYGGRPPAPLGVQDALRQLYDDSGVAGFIVC